MSHHDSVNRLQPKRSFSYAFKSFNSLIIISPPNAVKLITALALTGLFAVLPAQALISPTASVGATPGSFAVSPSGAATYTIPIVVPPGTNGMQPNLALVYNSQSGNGLLGMGWGLSGLSVIHRCGRTIELDGIKGGVGYNANDRFCLDGERLVSIGNSQYRTEKESLQKITASDTTHNPAWFTVIGKDGITREYAVPIEAAGNPAIRRLWALSKIQDRHGNYLSIAYDKADVNLHGDYRPSSISYTANDGVSVAAYNSVTFTYATRLDAPPAYEAGSVTRILKRLTNVTTKVGSTIVREYRLTYDNYGASGRSRLTSVQECGTDNVCLPATTLGWQNGGSNFNVEIRSVPNVWGGPNLNWADDFNGDGKTDLATANGSNVQMRLSTNSGFIIQTWSTTSVWGGAGYNWTGDFNADGKADLATANGAGVVVRLSTGSGFSTQTWPVPNVWGADYYNWTGDFNGDGKTDLATANGGEIHVRLSTGSGFDVQVWPVPNVWSPLTWTGDFNGDGKTDIAVREAANLYVHLSTGSGFDTQNWPVPNVWGADYYNWTGDFNGDGKTDLATANGGGDSCPAFDWQRL